MKHMVRLLLVVGVVVALIASAVPSYAAAEREDDSQSVRDSRTIQGQGSGDDSNSAAATDRGRGSETATDARQADRAEKYSDPQSVSKRWWWWWHQGQNGNDDEDDEGDTSPTDEDDE